MKQIINKEMDVSNNPIDPNKIFILSSFEFDLLVSFSIKEGKEISEYLNDAFINNQTPENEKFSFSMHFKN